MSVEIKLDADTLRVLRLFENMTRVPARDCLEDEERIVFVVPEEEVGRAIGKQASNLKKLREVLKKEVEIVGFSPDRQKFIANIFHRYKVEDITVDERKDGTVHVRVRVDAREKGRAIGRGGRNIQLARELAKRHHGVHDVSVD